MEEVNQWSIKLENGEIYMIQRPTEEALFEAKESFMERIMNINAGIKPEPKVVHTPAEECTHEEYWTNVVKKEGENQGRHFKSCKKCRKFLGWVD